MTLEDDISNYPQGLVLVPHGEDDNSVVVGPHIRGSRLRASAAGDEEVDLLLPGTARYVSPRHKMCTILAIPENHSKTVQSSLADILAFT